MAESTIQGVTNAELVELNRRKQQKSYRLKGNYRAARYMNEAVLKEQQTNQANKAQKAVVTSLNRLGSDIFNPKEKPIPKSRPTLKKKPLPPTISHVRDSDTRQDRSTPNGDIGGNTK